MRLVFCFVDRVDFEAAGGPGDAPPGPGDVVRSLYREAEGRVFILMVSGTDENTLARELSVLTTRNARRRWMYSGDMQEAV